MPLDVAPSPLGNVWIREDGKLRVLSRGEAQRGRETGAVLFMPHHATCPARERHERVGRNQPSLFGDAA